MIWFQKDLELKQLNSLLNNTMGGYLDLKFTAIGDDYLRMSMPVTEKTRQPYGFIHGGANCVLIETIGSIGSALVIDIQKYYCVGIEINANHLRSVTQGSVEAIARPLHLGKSTHVWEVKIQNEEGKLTCAGRLTVAILKHKVPA
ncbi:MAG: hotdog fold thioesterase [Chitinophagaceae bacterium]|nr:hotdog fold thioesterase [Chitinophagaceae bacterium]